MMKSPDIARHILDTSSENLRQISYLRKITGKRLAKH